MAKVTILYIVQIYTTLVKSQFSHDRNSFPSIDYLAFSTMVELSNKYPISIATTSPAHAAPGTSCSLPTTSEHSSSPRRKYYYPCGAVSPTQSLVELQVRDRPGAEVRSVYQRTLRCFAIQVCRLVKLRLRFASNSVSGAASSGANSILCGGGRAKRAHTALPHENSC